MAISAHFTADFSSFTAALDKATVKLRTFEDGAGKVDATLSRMGNKFSGTKLIQDALAMEKAIAKIGGAAALTDRELQEAGRTAAEAAEKMDRLGLKGADGLRALAKQAEEAAGKLKQVGDAKPVEQMNQSFLSMSGILKSLGPQILATFSIGAIVGFGKSLLDMSGQLVDLSDETGVSIQQLQELDYAAKGAGLTVTDLAGSVNQLSNRLASGDKSASEALDKLGLSLYEIQNQSADEALLDIARGFESIEDPMQRTALAMDLFGKAGPKMLRVFANDLPAAMEEAKRSGATIDENLIRKAEAFDEAWARAIDRFKAGAMGMIGAITLTAGSLDQLEQNINDVRAARDRLGDKAPTSDPGFEAMLDEWNARTLPGMVESAERGGANARGAWNRGLRMGPAIPPEEAARLAGILSPEQIKAQEKAARDLAQAQAEAAKTAEAAYQAQKKWNRDIEDFTRGTQRAALGITAVRYEGGRWITQLSSTMPAAITATAVSIEGRLIPAFQRTQDELMALATAKPPDLFFGNQNVSQEVGDPISKMDQITGSVGELSDAFVQLAQVSGDSWGGVSRDIAQAASEFQLMGRSLDQFGQPGWENKVSGAIGAATAFESATGSGSRGKRVASGAATGAQIGAFFGPIGMGIGAGVGALVGVFRGQSEGEKANDLRDAYIAAAGGITKLDEAAKKAGTSVNALLKAKNVKDYEAAVTALQGKLGQFASEQAADAARLEAAVQKYGFAWEELGAKIQQSKLDDQAKELIEDWRVLVAAGIDVATVNDKMGESLSEYLNTALKVGAEIPAAMKPILERMAAQGTLTDEAGNAITDLNSVGIRYAETMTQGFDRIVDKLDELIQKLITAGDAIGDLPSEHDLQVNVHYNMPDVPTQYSFEANALPGYAKGTGGRYLDFGEGTPVMLHGRERVVPEGEGTAASSGMLAMAASITALQVSIVRAIRENSLNVRDQTMIALGRA